MHNEHIALFNPLDCLGVIPNDLKKDWIEHLYFWNEVDWQSYWKVHFNTLRFHQGLLFSLMIVGILWMLKTSPNNCAAIVSKEQSQYNFFGSHIGTAKEIGFNIWVQKNRMLDPVFILRSVGNTQYNILALKFQGTGLPYYWQCWKFLGCNFSTWKIKTAEST